MRLRPEEPAATDWRPIELTELAALVLDQTPAAPGRPGLIAVDGRGASGKSSLVAALSAEIADSAVVHTDDVAWHEPFFGWGSLLKEHILVPLRGGAAVDYRPAAWQTHDRPGRITVPAGRRVVFIEGTGASQRDFADLLDATIWVQADYDESERRGLARDIASGVNGDADQATRFWHEWMSYEHDFLAAEQPWQRAAFVVAGTQVIDQGPDQWAIGQLPK